MVMLMFCGCFLLMVMVIDILVVVLKVVMLWWIDFSVQMIVVLMFDCFGSWVIGICRLKGILIDLLIFMLWFFRLFIVLKVCFSVFCFRFLSSLGFVRVGSGFLMCSSFILCLVVLVRVFSFRLVIGLGIFFGGWFVILSLNCLFLLCRCSRQLFLVLVLLVFECRIIFMFIVMFLFIWCVVLSILVCCLLVMLGFGSMFMVICMFMLIVCCILLFGWGMKCSCIFCGLGVVVIEVEVSRGRSRVRVVVCMGSFMEVVVDFILQVCVDGKCKELRCVFWEGYLLLVVCGLKKGIGVLVQMVVGNWLFYFLVLMCFILMWCSFSMLWFCVSVVFCIFSVFVCVVVSFSWVQVWLLVVVWVVVVFVLVMVIFCFCLVFMVFSLFFVFRCNCFCVILLLMVVMQFGLKVKLCMFILIICVLYRFSLVCSVFRMLFDMVVCLVIRFGVVQCVVIVLKIFCVVVCMQFCRLLLWLYFLNILVMWLVWMLQCMVRFILIGCVLLVLFLVFLMVVFFVCMLKMFSFCYGVISRKFFVLMFLMVLFMVMMLCELVGIVCSGQRRVMSSSVIRLSVSLFSSVGWWLDILVFDGRFLKSMVFCFEVKVCFLYCFGYMESIRGEQECCENWKMLFIDLIFDVVGVDGKFDVVVCFLCLLNMVFVEGCFVKLLLSKFSGEDKSVECLMVCEVVLWGEWQFFFLWWYQIKDVMKNCLLKEGVMEVVELFGM